MRSRPLIVQGALQRSFASLRQTHLGDIARAQVLVCGQLETDKRPLHVQHVQGFFGSVLLLCFCGVVEIE
jgi:hypothetical protein